MNTGRLTTRYGFLCIIITSLMFYYYFTSVFLCLLSLFLSLCSFFPLWLLLISCLFFPCCDSYSDSSLLMSVSSYRLVLALPFLSSRRGRTARKRRTEHAKPELTAHGFTRLAQLQLRQPDCSYFMRSYCFSTSPPNAIRARLCQAEARPQKDRRSLLMSPFCRFGGVGGPG